MGLREFTEELDQRFYDDLSKEDGLGVVVRGLIHIEHELIGLLEVNVENVKALENMRLDFQGRVQLAVALGLKDDLAPPLSALAKLRNRLAHELAVDVGENEAASLYDAFRSGEKQVIQSTYNRVRRQTKGHPSRFASMPVLDRIKIMIVALRQAVRVGRIQSIEMKEVVAEAVQHYATSVRS